MSKKFEKWCWENPMTAAAIGGKSTLAELKRLRKVRRGISVKDEEQVYTDQDIRTILKEMQGLRKLVVALDNLCDAYRIGKQPSNKTLDTISKYRPLLEKIREGKS